ncbi:portal protein [Mycobacterium phage MyraDee]|uniref:Portal protein n=1 Tax=Mycobacterium phage MyraDee TaxID=2024303 RepID=A0A222YXU4_9CAUD|nr:portal protein [Mycobacterium phage MyraDee]ASR77118.1 portal protein [Mycobacterium phage MyraDee]
MADETKVVDVDKARDDLLNLFEQKQNDLKDAKAYYEAERRPDAIGLAVPPKMRALLSHVGYPRVYVDSIAERQELEGFRLGGADEADEELWDWWSANNLDIEATLGHADALVYGRSYITVSKPDPKIDLDVDPDVPIIRVEPPTSLYAAIDPRTRQVTQAIRAILDEDGNDTIAATLYLPDKTVIWNKVEGEWELVTTVTHGLEMVPVIPLANRTRLSDLYGTSEISPELRSVTDAAARVLMNMQATAELMAIPQRLLFGVDPKEIGIDPDTGQKLFDAYMARILAFDSPEGKAEQFSAAELRNFVDALDALDRKAASYTGLPPQYLSNNSDNPASAEAIKASESRLVKKTERKNKIFGGAWEQAMRVAYKVMNGGETPPEYFRMETIWRDPSTPTYAAKADAASKLYNGGNGVIPKERARMDIGYSVTEREEMRKWDEEENPMGLMGTMYGTDPSTPKPTPDKPTPTPAPAKEPDAA